MPRDWAIASPLIVVGAALATTMLVIALRPLMQRYALARPNARSSHRTPTPQGAGMAVVAVAGAVVVFAQLLAPELAPGSAVAPVLIAAAALAVLGAVDDIVTLRALPRLVCQMVAATAVVASLPEVLRIAPWCPLIVERIALVLALVWCVNLVNFMDGIDWITVAEVVPVCFGVCIIVALGKAPPIAAVISLALGGAMLGFAPFNRPVATLFLGDVGSLPIGLLLGWLLILVAGSGAVTAAIVLPLYYLADATITLGRRLLRGERVWEAHRSHFYQQATDNGFTVLAIVARIFVVNVLLVGLASISAGADSVPVSITTLVLAGVLVARQLLSFSRVRA